MTPRSSKCSQSLDSSEVCCRGLRSQRRCPMSFLVLLLFCFCSVSEEIIGDPNRFLQFFFLSGITCSFWNLIGSVFFFFFFLSLNVGVNLDCGLYPTASKSHIVLFNPLVLSISHLLRLTRKFCYFQGFFRLERWFKS